MNKYNELQVTNETNSTSTVFRVHCSSGVNSEFG